MKRTTVTEIKRFVEVEVNGVVECVTESLSMAMAEYATVEGAIIRPTRERKTLGGVRHGIEALVLKNGRWWSIKI